MSDKPFDHIDSYKQAVRNSLTYEDGISQNLTDFLLVQYEQEINALFSGGVAPVAAVQLLFAAAKVFHQ